jgi:hypothetical protein
MRRLFALTALLAALLAPTASAFAAEYEWTEGISKQGLDGFVVCSATTTVAGNTVTIGHNVGPDEAQPVASERAWQRTHCERLVRETTAGVFLYRFEATIDPSIVRVSFQQAP